MEYGFVYQAVARWKRFQSSGKKMMKLMNVLMMIWRMMGEEDDGEEDADISIVVEADENGEDYSVYRKVEDEDEEDDDMCFEDIKKIQGGRSNGNSIYVNQSFVSKDALFSELRLTAVRFRFSFKIYKSTKTLLVTTCPVSGCQWKRETDSLSGDTVLRSMLVGFSLIVLESLMG
ncbi:hypothetical protein F2Q68_00005988 [Brassica cretica]|uniref:Transposase MuDR plant domain-containing protein n=1 Tax=Brassica cretica TaxID=69181 RepID=A0A8S9JCV1_BRACR|nr:hypothetical protein F2Q68_00005988 [Brassica cretica]